MSIWGKILGGAAGFAIGGPLGALMGALAGHAVDLVRTDETAGKKPPEEAIKSIAFTVGVIVLSAKMAKVDGTVKRVEIDTFKRLFHVPSDEMKNVGRVFDLARRDSAGFEVYARQIAALFEERHAVLEELLASLLRIAEADDEVHDAEMDYLRAIAAIFGFDDAEFRRIMAEHCVLCGKAETDPYAVLGVSRGDDAAAIKTAYRRLVQEHHPDRLIAQGMPEEFVELANDKMAAINAAYDRIQKERQLA
ncbi:TerB family tellurite resistance protein [Azospirillum sp.]|uniref:TerB family tellurite resistance protein n=1 Tax=Azospirillum sp. TaxID=34012 RepID=UPI002D253A5A|nr:TerB family tellurite resistance protein [Azospirillum sp.]HYD65791.1 TerB family tellurite resistance protein [Azospirillum sp.]